MGAVTMGLDNSERICFGGLQLETFQVLTGPFDIPEIQVYRITSISRTVSTP